MAAMSDWGRVLKCWPALDWSHVPDDPFDPTPWFSMFYNDVDLDAIDWADEMRKLPGQFDDRPFFGDTRARRIISEALAGQW